MYWNILKNMVTFVIRSVFGLKRVSQNLSDIGSYSGDEWCHFTSWDGISFHHHLHLYWPRKFSYHPFWWSPTWTSKVWTRIPWTMQASSLTNGVGKSRWMKMVKTSESVDAWTRWTNPLRSRNQKFKARRSNQPNVSIKQRWFNQSTQSKTMVIWWIQVIQHTPPKTNMTMEKQPLGNVFPIENWPFPLPVLVFRSLLHPTSKTILCQGQNSWY